MQADRSRTEKSTIRRPVPKVWRLQGPVLEHDLVRDAFPFVGELVSQSRRARTVSDHIVIQQRLAAGALAIRDFDRKTKEHRQKLREEIRHAQADKGRLADLGAALRGVEEALAANQRRLLALRSVQDGIIWRLLAFDRETIGVLGLGQPVGYPSQSFEHECSFAEREWEAGRLAIFCDLSSCRTGDLLIFDPRSGQVTVAEVAESRLDTKRKVRQRERVDQRLDFLTTSRSEVLAPTGMPLVSTARRPRLKTHLSNLVDLFTRARREVGAHGRVSEHLFVEAFDARALRPEHLAPDSTARFERRRERAQIPSWRNASKYEWDSMHRLHRDEKGALATTAPYSLFPLDDATTAALCLGYVGYRTVLNLDYLISYLKRKGWTVEMPGAEGMYMTIMRRVGRQGFVVGVNPAQMEQFVVELLSLGAFAAFVEAALTQAREAITTTHVTWAWSGEERIWH